MDRLKMQQKWSIFEYENVFFIEPAFRHEMVMEKIHDVIDTYKPGVVIKAGLGSGKIVLDLIDNYKDIKLVVVEPSLRIIEDFIKSNSGNGRIREIGFINGGYNSFPVDYYAADLIISIDNLDIQETAPVIDEFKRALQFDGHFLFAGVVLDDEDVEGIYDDFMRILSPFHNDYYLKDDLKTFMKLKEFTFVKGKIDRFDCNIDEMERQLQGIYGDIDTGAAESYLGENAGTFAEIYKLNGRNINLPYFTGVFMRKKG